MKPFIRSLLLRLSPVYRKLCRLEETIGKIERQTRYTYLRGYHDASTVRAQSQFGQDVFVESIFGGMREGTFLELGALDGVTASNTYYLEEELDWTGVLIEANPRNYSQLAKNRSACHCIQACVSDSRGGAVEFVDHGGLSGIKAQLGTEYAEFTDRAPVIRLETESLQSILDRLQIRHLDYLSVDTEGSELSVLKSVDYSKTDITLIGVEVANQGYDRAFGPLRDFLGEKGYGFLERVGIDCFFHKLRRS